MLYSACFIDQILTPTVLYPYWIVMFGALRLQPIKFGKNKLSEGGGIAY